MLSKIRSDIIQQDAALTQRLSDLLFDISKSLIDAKEYEEALKWLERALDTLSQTQFDGTNVDVTELRLCILHGLGTVQTNSKIALSS